MDYPDLFLMFYDTIKTDYLEIFYDALTTKKVSFFFTKPST